MDYLLTEHARDALEKRQIPVAWMEMVFHAPQETESDPLDADLEHRLTRIREFDNRVLRVTINVRRTPPLIVTVFLTEGAASDEIERGPTDALYLTLTQSPSTRSEEIAPGIIDNYDERGCIVGIGMRCLSKRVPWLDTERILLESVAPRT